MISLADRYELDWRLAKEAKKPRAVVDALELRWRETLEGARCALHFIPRVSPKLEHPTHLEAIADFFCRAENGPVLMCSSVPPQHGKTITITHMLVWYMLRHPEKRSAYVSYSIDRAKRVGIQMLEIARRAGLRLKVNNQDHWVTEEGGELHITGIGGSITGEPIDGIFVVDDAHKDREEANSVAIRQKAIDYVTVTAAGRLHPCTSVLVNGTRWHLQDVIGHLQDREQAEPVGWTFTNIPAITTTGEALWPKHRPLEFLHRQRRILGDYDFAAEYLGQPVTEEAEVFHAPARYTLADCDPRTGARILIACDPAVTAKASSDFSAIVVGAMRPDPDGLHSLDILDYRSLQVETPALVQELKDLSLRWRSPVAIEAVGPMKAVPQMLRQIDRTLVVIELQPKGDKLVRARPAAAAWNDGRIRVPEMGKTPWVDRFVRDVRAFTGVGDKHDDAPDALAHLWSTLAEVVGKRNRADVAARLARSLPFAS